MIAGRERDGPIMTTKNEETKEPVTSEQFAEQLLKVLHHHRDDPHLSRLLHLIVRRLDEIENKFNSHCHITSTNMRGSEYESAGSGKTGPPAKPGPFGCHQDIRIGS